MICGVWHPFPGLPSRLYFALQAVGDYLFEALSTFGIDCRDTLVRVPTDKLPFGVTLNEFCVVVHLGVIGGFLLRGVGTDTSVKSDTLFEAEFLS